MFAVLLLTANALNGHTLFGRDARMVIEAIKNKEPINEALFLSPEFAADVMERGSRGVQDLPGFSKRARGSCIETDQCYVGDNPGADCCIGKVTNSAGDIKDCTQLGSCNMCTQVATKAVKMGLGKGTCVLAGAGSLCVASIIGTPFLVAACLVAVPMICSAVVQKIMDYADPGAHIEEIANSACEAVGLCGGNTPSNIKLGQACGCVESGDVWGFGSCASDVSHCCSGKKKALWRQAPCSPPLVKCD